MTERANPCATIVQATRVTHNPLVAERAGRAITMRDGRIDSPRIGRIGPAGVTA